MSLERGLAAPAVGGIWCSGASSSQTTGPILDSCLDAGRAAPRGSSGMRWKVLLPCLRVAIPTLCYHDPTRWPPAASMCHSPPSASRMR